jgi:hypothetical protein
MILTLPSILVIASLTRANCASIDECRALHTSMDTPLKDISEFSLFSGHWGHLVLIATIATGANEMLIPTTTKAVPISTGDSIGGYFFFRPFFDSDANFLEPYFFRPIQAARAGLPTFFVRDLKRAPLPNLAFRAITYRLFSLCPFCLSDERQPTSSGREAILSCVPLLFPPS